MKKIIFSIFFGLCLLSCIDKSINQNVLIAEQLKELKADEDATPLIRQLLSQVSDNTEILIPKGIYTFYPEFAGERYCIISNNDNGHYRILFDLVNKKNITINGQGSEFIFNGHIIPFNLEDAENITLRNFSIDWERTFHSEGLVVNVNDKEKFFDISISEDFPYRIEANQLIWLEKLSENQWSTNMWKQDIRNNLFFDSETKATSYRVKDYKLNPYFPLLHTQYRAEEIEKGLVRIYQNISELPEPGWVWVSKGNLENTRQSPAIRILGGSKIRLENINIYHAGAMGIIGERSSDIELDNVNIILPPNKNRIVTTTADATHFVNCGGQITINNCTFENMLDDATNIHGTYLKLIKTTGPKTLLVHAVHPQQNTQRWAKSGDSIFFRNNQTMHTYKKLIIKEFRIINHRYAEMEFEESVADLVPDSGIENPIWNPMFTMTGCTVKNNRARSILLSSGKKMVIENNTFKNSMMAAISIAGDMNYWFESGNVNELIIKNNKFINGCTGGFNQAIITIEPIITHPQADHQPYHRNIVIDSNVFETFDNPILDIFSTENLTFTNNIIRKNYNLKPIFPDKPAIFIRNSLSTTVKNNQFENGAKSTIEGDSKSLTTLSEINNITINHTNP